jgi:hypothetical protein
MNFLRNIVSHVAGKPDASQEERDHHAHKLAASFDLVVPDVVLDSSVPEEKALQQEWDSLLETAADGAFSRFASVYVHLLRTPVLRVHMLLRLYHPGRA